MSVNRAPPSRNPGEVEAAFAAAPDHLVAEILEGELHLAPRPRPRHARAAGRLAGELDGPFDQGRGGPGGWLFLAEPELHLGERPDKVVPDLAGWRRERFPAGALDRDAPAHLTVAPDWVCEVLSESTEKVDRGKKLRIYRRERVTHVWLLSPTVETLEVYRLEGQRHALVETYEGEAPIRAEPFEAIELILPRLWSP